VSSFVSTGAACPVAPSPNTSIPARGAIHHCGRRSPLHPGRRSKDRWTRRDHRGPAGVRHSEGNLGSIAIEGVVELRPALRTKEFHEAVAGLVADGRTTSRGAPKHPLRLRATFWHFRHESRVTSPPIVVQNLMLPILWALARVLGVKPYYERGDSRVSE
jgi:hypothetical protein